jgi:hypothetical protein
VAKGLLPKERGSSAWPTQEEERFLRCVRNDGLWGGWCSGSGANVVRDVS